MRAFEAGTVVLAGLLLLAAKTDFADRALALVTFGDSQDYMSSSNPWAKDYEPGTVQPTIRYRNCDAARSAGAAPLYYGEPGYASHLDGDDDGIACEPYRGR